MRPDTWRLLDEALGSPPTLRAREGATVDEVAAAGGALGVTMPDDYVEFLLRVGGAIVGPYPVFGLRFADAMEPRDVVQMTQSFRSDWGIPQDWLVISMDHAGNPFAIKPSGNVVLRDHDFGGTHAVADSFESFLLHCLTLRAA